MGKERFSSRPCPPPLGAGPEGEKNWPCLTQSYKSWEDVCGLTAMLPSWDWEGSTCWDCSLAVAIEMECPLLAMVVCRDMPIGS